MGLPMMDSIHAPTVASGPTSGASTGGSAKNEETALLDLIGEKERVERELKALSGVLDSVCYFEEARPAG